MAGLSNHVSISITVDSVGLTAPGFGLPAILAYPTGWGALEKLRFYTSLADVIVDFPTTTGPEYLAAQAMFSQEPAPETIAILKGSLPPTQKYTLAATASNSHTYAVSVNGSGVTATLASYTADSATTVAEVHNGMVTAINAVATNNYIAAFAALVNADDTFTAASSDICTAVAHGLVTGDGPFQLTTSAADLPLNLLTATDYWIIKIDADTFYLATSLANALAGTQVDIADAGTGTHTIADTASTVRPSSPFTVTADTAGAWFSLSITPSEMSLWSISQSHVDPGVATDLAAALVADSTWYGFVTLFNSDAYVKAAAAFAQANRKLYFVDISESDAVMVASDGTQGTFDDLKTLGYSYVTGYWHETPSQMIAAAAIGNFFPYDPGAATAKFKQLIGVGDSSLTTTQRTNLTTRRVNFLEEVAGISIVANGTVFSTTIGFTDVRRDLDYVESDLAIRVFGALAGAAKVPYTDAGVALIENQVRSGMRSYVSLGIFSPDPAPRITVPKVADVATADKTSRILRNVKWNATLAGAIHSVIITGVVSA